MGGVERLEPAELGLLLVVGGAGQLDLDVLGGLGAVGRRRRQERVDADEREGAVVLAGLVQERLVLDAAPLVAGLHGAEDAAALRDAVELGQHRGLHQVGELVDDERPLVGVLVHGQAPLLVDDELDGQGPANGLLGGGGDGLVVGVGVQ